MSDKVKIYKWHGNGVQEFEARETPKLYILEDRPAAFGYGSQISKSEARLTPEQAIQEKLNDLKMLINIHTRRLENAKARLAEVQSYKYPHF